MAEWQERLITKKPWSRNERSTLRVVNLSKKEEKWQETEGIP
jgi:hypothetical protein